MKLDAHILVEDIKDQGYAFQMYSSEVNDKIEVKTYDTEGFVCLGIAKLSELNFL
jgi:hypothetical protein